MRSLVLMLSLLCAVVPILHVPVPTAQASSSFVTRAGTQFMLDGAPYKFVGANMYNAAGDPSIYECGPWMSNPEVELADWFARSKADFGGKVVRFWAFQRYTKGGTDWRAFDRVMRLAAQYDVKVIPVLENQWGDCTDATKTAAWYGGGYRQPSAINPLPYDEFVRRVVQRYRNEPAIFSWMLMNEAESRGSNGAADPASLLTFTRDMSALVKSLDPNHLVTLGVIGAGQPGTASADYDALHALPGIDYLTFHDYGNNDQPLPGAPIIVKSPLQSALFSVDKAWAFKQGTFVNNTARAWQTLTWTVPAGVSPFQKLGIILRGPYTGIAYIDRVEIGGRVLDFEDGTTQGFTSTASITLANSGDQRMSGNRSLKLTFNQPTGSGQVSVPALATEGAGTVITMRVYVDTPGTVSPQNTLAAAMYKATVLDKPFVVGESGMTTCTSIGGTRIESAASRASKFDAKLGAFFGNGGSGYLVWAWEPNSSCGFAFSTGDPLNGALKRHANGQP